MNQDEEQPNLDIVYRQATEAGIRLPFTIADLRKWAQQRRRVPKGHKKRSGQFLPEINLPDKETRGSTRPDVVDELDLPGEPETWRDILEQEEHPEVKKQLGPVAKRAEAKQQAADLAAERAKVPPAQLIRDDAAVAREAAEKMESSAKFYINQIPGRREAARKAKARAGWVQEYADEVEAEAGQRYKKAQAHHATSEAAAAKLDAALKKGDLKTAAALRDQMEEAAAAAEEERDALIRLRKKLESLAKVEPPKKYENAAWEAAFQKPPKGWRVADPREFFDINGNNPTWRGAWVPKEDPETGLPVDPTNHLAYTLSHATVGSGNAAKRESKQFPEFALARERAKWDRIQAFKKFSPTLFKYWNDELARLNKKPKLTAEEQAYKQHLTVGLVAQLTGMRRGDEKNETGIKKSDDIRTALIERAADAGASQELLDRATKVPEGEKEPPTLEEVMEIFDADARLAANPDFKYNKKPDGRPDIKVPTYGATTLLKEHVTFDKDENGNEIAKFNFIGKSGVENSVKLSDPNVIAALKERKLATKDGEPLFPGVTGDTLKKMMDRTVGEAQGLSRAEAEAAGLVPEDDAGDLAGKFTPHDLRRLWANITAPEIFNRIMKEKGRLPQDADEFAEWVAIAGVLAAEELGNQPNTFLKNYLSMASFADVIQQMMAAGGPQDPEEYWPFGAKMLLPGGKYTPEALELGKQQEAGWKAREAAKKAATARRNAPVKKKAPVKKAPVKRTAPRSR